MTEDQLANKIKYLTNRIDCIAERTKQLALKECANSKNPEFVDLIDLQSKMCSEIDKVLDVYEAQLTSREEV